MQFTDQVDLVKNNDTTAVQSYLNLSMNKISINLKHKMSEVN